MAMWLIVPCGTVVFLHGSVSGSICTRKLVAYLTCTYVHTEYIIIIVVIVVISLGFYSRDTYVVRKRLGKLNCHVILLMVYP